MAKGHVRGGGRCEWECVDLGWVSSVLGIVDVVGDGRLLACSWPRIALGALEGSKKAPGNAMLLESSGACNVPRKLLGM